MKSPNILAWGAAALSMAMAFYTTYVSSGTRAAREGLTEVTGAIETAVTRAEAAVTTAEGAATAAAEAGAAATDGLAMLGSTRDEVAALLAEVQAAGTAATDAAAAAAAAQAGAEAAATAAGGATEGLDAQAAALADAAARAEAADAAIATRAAELEAALTERMAALDAAVAAVDAAAARAEAAAANAGEQAGAAQAAQIAAEAALTQVQTESRPSAETPENTTTEGAIAPAAAGVAIDMATVLTVDGFNLDQALAGLAASSLPQDQQQFFATALKNASTAPALLPEVLTAVRGALGL